MGIFGAGFKNKETLIGCFNELDGEKAVGIDRVTKEEWDGFNEFMKHFPPTKSHSSAQDVLKGS